MRIVISQSPSEKESSPGPPPPPLPPGAGGPLGPGAPGGGGTTAAAAKPLWSSGPGPRAPFGGGGSAATEPPTDESDEHLPGSGVTATAEPPAAADEPPGSNGSAAATAEPPEFDEQLGALAAAQLPLPPWPPLLLPRPPRAVVLPSSSLSSTFVTFPASRDLTPRSSRNALTSKLPHAVPARLARSCSKPALIMSRRRPASLSTT